jgi:hypothetical protein
LDGMRSRRAPARTYGSGSSGRDSCDLQMDTPPESCGKQVADARGLSRGGAAVLGDDDGDLVSISEQQPGNRQTEQIEGAGRLPRRIECRPRFLRRRVRFGDAQARCRACATVAQQAGRLRVAERAPSAQPREYGEGDRVRSGVLPFGPFGHPSTPPKISAWASSSIWSLFNACVA